LIWTVEPLVPKVIEPVVVMFEADPEVKVAICAVAS
jgi:hypothetical protein